MHKGFGMKVFVIVNNYEPVEKPFRLGWYFIVDSAITNTGKPFYLPENRGKTEVSMGVAVRISRLGKSIHPQYGQRYFKEYAPVLHFTLPEFGERLKECGLPEDESRNFDRSLFVGDYMPKGDKEVLKLVINGEERAEFSFDKLHIDIDDSLYSISQLHTLKIGDLLVPALNGFIPVKEGDFLEVIKGDKRLFHVKVK